MCFFHFFQKKRSEYIGDDEPIINNPEERAGGDRLDLHDQEARKQGSGVGSRNDDKKISEHDDGPQTSGHGEFLEDSNERDQR